MLPGTPKEEDVPAVGYANLGGKHYVVSWKSSSNKPGGNRENDKAEVSIGWIDLDSEKLKGVQFDQIAIPVRVREAERLGGKVRLGSTVGFIAHGKKYEAEEYIIESDIGIAILRLYIQVGDPRKRMYFLVAKGPDLDPKAGWVLRFFNSFDPLPFSE